MKNLNSINKDTEIKQKELELEKAVSEINIHNDFQEIDPYNLFIYSLRSPYTKESYIRRLKKFFEVMCVKGDIVECCNYLVKNGRENPKWIFNLILRFSQIQKERADRREITGGTLRNYLKTIKTFCEINDLEIPWKKIMRGLPRVKRYADDRIPTDKEIQKLLEYPDRRIKAIVYTMASSGIRLGSWDYLKWGHIRPITDKEDNDEEAVITAKIVVYAEEDEEYFTFISKEAYKGLKDWMNYRECSGELIDENSWLMRDLWDTRVAQGRGFVTKPKKLASSGIKRLIERAIWAQGLRKRPEFGKKRHPFQAIHCFRKWFKTRCEIAGMKPINIEKLLAHSIGISNSYYRPTENELLEDYLKAVKNLTISENKNENLE
jgi:integrase